MRAQFAYLANGDSETISGYSINPVTGALTAIAGSPFPAGAGIVVPISIVVVATVGVGAIPVDVSISPNGARVYVTNADSNSVSVIDTSTNTVNTTVPVGVRPVYSATFLDRHSRSSIVFVLEFYTNLRGVTRSATPTSTSTSTIERPPLNPECRYASPYAERRCGECGWRWANCWFGRQNLWGLTS